jgi:hypothetical protein
MTGNRTRSATLLPVIVPLRVVTTQAIATHAPVNVPALDVITAKAGDGRGIWRDASGSGATVEIIDEVTIREAETG